MPAIDRKDFFFAWKSMQYAMKITQKTLAYFQKKNYNCLATEKC